VVTDPTVRAVLESNPVEPAELVRAIETLINLRHAAAGKAFMQRLAGWQLEDKALAELVGQYGTGTFLRMALQPALNPEATEFSQRALDGANRYHRSPERIAELLAQLKDPSPDVRSRAAVRLRRGGDAAVNAMLGVLANAELADDHANVRTALVELGANAVGPITAGLASPNAELKAQIAEILGRMGAKESAAYLLLPAVSPQSPERLRAAARTALQKLLGAVPTRDEAVRLLYNEARLYYEGKAAAQPDAEGRVALWSWDAAGQATSAHYDAADGALVVAARLAGNLYQLEPRSIFVRRLYLGSLLELAAIQAGPGQPLPTGEGTAYDLAKAAGEEAISDLLKEALQTDRPRAAAACVRILGELVSADYVQRDAPKPSLLARAVVSPDRRLRFAAVGTLVKLDPKVPYAGSSGLTEALVFFARSSGVPKALVADRSMQEAQRLAGLLSGLGFDVTTAMSTHELLKRASSSPDYAFAVVDTRLPGISSDFLLQQLGQDWRTAELPVGLVAPLEELDAAQRLTRLHRHTAVVIRPQDHDAMQSQLERLLSAVGRDLIPQNERNQHAAQALHWIAQLTAGPQPVYDFRRHERAIETPLYDPGLSALAAAAMANLGTPLSQTALVDLASGQAMPLEARQAAVDAFRRSVARFGPLLTTQQIQLQYDRYNQSVLQPKETQDLLGAILDILESRVAQAEQPAEENPAGQQRRAP
jgi:CheY-like chemotaxis protein